MCIFHEYIIFGHSFSSYSGCNGYGLPEQSRPQRKTGKNLHLEQRKTEKICI